MATEARRVWVPDVPVAPGETIREILEDRAISQVDFATRLGRSEKFVSQLVNGKAPLTYETALELERVLGVPATFWNRSEATYRGLLARQQKVTESDERAEWAGSFPLKEMADKGFVARETSPAEQAEELLSFFGVSSIDAYREYWGSLKRLAERMSAGYDADTASVTAWLRAGERAAEQVRTEPFDEASFRRVLTELRGASRLSPETWLPLITERCAVAGVAVVFVPELSTTHCHSVSWWASRSRAVIQLGLGHGTDDQVWFSFSCEAGHLLLDDRGRSRRGDLDGGGPWEDRANAFAVDFLIAPAEYLEFVSHGRPSKAQVVAFAEALGIAPSIVVGRLQREGVVPCEWMNALKTKVEWAG